MIRYTYMSENQLVTRADAPPLDANDDFYLKEPT